MQLKIKYHNKNIKKLTMIEKGDWCDLYSAETIELNHFQSALISLGISIEIPAGYEAHIVPRSSTFSKWGVIQTNGIGIIDNSYAGNDDVWKMPVLAMRNTVIREGDRICQFRVIEKQEKLDFIEVDDMTKENRGGFGSTGMK